MDPIKGNSLNRSCGEVISSNCVTVPIATAGVCGPNPSLTQVLTALQSCCNSTTNTCYTGQWANLSFPSAGSGTSLTGNPYTYTITDVGFSGVYDVPMYKWTREGDLSVRGGFRLTLNSSVQRDFINIPLGSISISCLPTGYKDQSILVSMDEYVEGQFISVIHGELILTSLGNLVLQVSFARVIPSTFIFDIDLGGSRFNIA